MCRSTAGTINTRRRRRRHLVLMCMKPRLNRTSLGSQEVPPSSVAASDVCATHTNEKRKSPSHALEITLPSRQCHSRTTLTFINPSNERRLPGSFQQNIKEIKTICCGSSKGRLPPDVVSSDNQTAFPRVFPIPDVQ